MPSCDRTTPSARPSGFRSVSVCSWVLVQWQYEIKFPPVTSERNVGARKQRGEAAVPQDGFSTRHRRRRVSIPFQQAAHIALQPFFAHPAWAIAEGGSAPARIRQGRGSGLPSPPLSSRKVGEWHAVAASLHLFAHVTPSLGESCAPVHVMSSGTGPVNTQDNRRFRALSRRAAGRADVRTGLGRSSCVSIMALAMASGLSWHNAWLSHRPATPASFCCASCPGSAPCPTPQPAQVTKPRAAVASRVRVIGQPWTGNQPEISKLGACGAANQDGKGGVGRGVGPGAFGFNIGCVPPRTPSLSPC